MSTLLSLSQKTLLTLVTRNRGNRKSPFTPIPSLPSHPPLSPTPVYQTFKVDRGCKTTRHGMYKQLSQVRSSQVVKVSDTTRIRLSS